MTTVVSNVFSIAIKGALAAIEASLAVNELLKRSEENEGKALQTASAVNKLVLLGFSIGEIGALLGGASSSSLMHLKSWELLPRGAELPIEAGKYIVKLTKDPSVENHIQLVEKGLIAPISGFIGTLADASAYYEKHFIEMSPEEREQATRPVYEYDSFEESFVLTGYKPVNLEECQKNLAMLQNLSSASGCVRISAELEIIGNSYKSAKSLYGQLALFFERHGERISSFQHRCKEAPIQQNETPKEKEEDLQENISLRALPFIPSPLHQDEVFKQYICPITQLPIRHPVGDPNGCTVYERSAILAWLMIQSVSPITKEPLTPDKLIERPALELLINRRLQEHEEKLWAYVASSPQLQEQLSSPPPSELIQDVEQESKKN
jgi:U-box domain.